ncbi:MAG: cytochrome c peroxidase [Acidobacteriota bacterium]
MRLGWLVWVVSVAACGWSEPDLVDGAFTPEQWAALQHQFTLPQPVTCNLPGAHFAAGASACSSAWQLADQLFADPLMSCDPAVVANDRQAQMVGCTLVSCATCHNSTKGFIDSRTPNRVSLGSVVWTGRNSMTLLNVGYKEQLASGASVFTWSGGNGKLGEQFTSAGQVLDLAIRSPMESSHHHVAALIRTNGNYAMLYTAAFGTGGFTDDETIFTNLERAFDVALAQRYTHDTPFDRWMRGDPSSGMSASAKRGFAVFVGKGTCVECHNGPLFSDLQFHDTGVPVAAADFAPTTPDAGLGGVTKNPDDNGKFLTGPLREIAATGPYMHDGAFWTLAEVIDFYRRGGVTGGYSGTRDPRITPLELTDGDAGDLEAFLRSLSDSDCDDGGSGCMGSGSGGGPPADAGIGSDAGSGGGGGPPPPDAPAGCTPPAVLCGSACVDVQTDANNCGTCGHACAYPTPTCLMGVCGP